MGVEHFKIKADNNMMFSRQLGLHQALSFAMTAMKTLLQRTVTSIFFNVLCNILKYIFISSFSVWNIKNETSQIPG